MQVLPQTRLTFYGPKRLQINMVPTIEADEFYQVLSVKSRSICFFLAALLIFLFSGYCNFFSFNFFNMIISAVAFPIYCCACSLLSDSSIMKSPNMKAFLFLFSTLFNIISNEENRLVCYWYASHCSFQLFMV